MSFDFPRYTNTASQPQKETSQPASSEQEVLADEDGGRLFLPSCCDAQFTSNP